MPERPPPDEDWAAAINLRTAAQALRAIEVESPEGEADASLPRVDGYLVARRLGAGGGGTVYLAVRAGSQRPLALKIFNQRLGESPQAGRAWRELDVLAQLHLAPIPRLIDYGEQDGHLYVATEFVDGYTLEEHCHRHQLNREQRVELLARVCDAAHELHEHGVIHRDLKPTNILIDPGGQPMLIDLGIASLLSRDVMDTLTFEGAPIGTPAFMAPEQARGEKASTRIDIYGLGAIAYVILLGDTPHAMNVTLHEAIRRVAHDPPREPRQLDPRMPKTLAAVLHKAVAPRAGDRYASAAALAADFRRWLRRDAVEAAGPSVAQRALRVIGRHPVLATGALCTLIAALILGSTLGAVWWLNNRPAVMERAEDGSWARLRSYGGRVLHEWQPALPRRLILAEFVKENQVAIIGVSQPYGFDPTCQLYAYALSDVAHPRWVSGTGPPDITMPQPISRAEGGLFKLNWAKTVEVFEESPGPEIVAVHGHPLYSPNVIRIYGLDGTVLYQVWHDGVLGDGIWIPERRLLVLAGLNSENNWRGRGVDPGGPDVYPHVLLGVKVRPGEVHDAWIRTPGGLGTVEPLWYRCLLPQPAVATLCSSGEVRTVLKRHAGYVPSGDDSTFLYQIWPGETSLWLEFLLDEHGRVIGGEPGETYRQARAALDLPDGNVFYFGDLPPLLVNPLDPTKPRTPADSEEKNR